MRTICAAGTHSNASSMAADRIPPSLIPITRAASDAAAEFASCGSCAFTLRSCHGRFADAG